VNVWFCAGSKHFEQRGRGIAAKIRADLVQLVEQDDGLRLSTRRSVWMMRPGRAPT
jgi:hypothetical protein